MKVFVTEEMRHAFEEERNREVDLPGEILNDLRKVGPQKPLGGLMVSAITDFAGSTPEILIGEAIQKGLSAKIITKTVVTPQMKEPRHIPILWIWDEMALSSLLQTNSETLKRHNWPQDTTGFVRNVTSVCAPKGPLYDLVADAFADYRSPGRTYTHLPDAQISP